MKLLHMSDLHLDSPFKGMTQKNNKLRHHFIQAPYEAFHRGVDLAISEGVDLVVISGDIYNSERQTISAQHDFMTKMEELKVHDIPVVIIHGNHDYLKEHHRLIKYPDNVHRFDNEQVDHVDLELANGESLRIYGFSYLHQWINEDKIVEYPVNPKETTYTVGLLHGALAGSEDVANRYAPFRLQDLKDKHYDYWALGHIHQQGMLSQDPLIQYAGTPQGHHRNESGQKGCYIIEFQDGRVVNNQFHSLAKIVWQDETLELQEEDQLIDIIHGIEEIMERYLNESYQRRQSYILSIHLKNPEVLSQELIEQIQEGELLTTLQPQERDSYFVLIHKIELLLSKHYQIFQFDKVLQESFSHVLQAYGEQSRDEEILKDFYNHSTLRNYFAFDQDEAFKDELVNRAKELIIYNAGLHPESEAEDNDHS